MQIGVWDGGAGVLDALAGDFTVAVLTGVVVGAEKAGVVEPLLRGLGGGIVGVMG